MKAPGWRASVACVSIGVTCILSTALWAGGAGFGDDDDNSAEEGPSYFGFVKDINGATVPDAKVTVGIKNRGGVVTRTDGCGRRTPIPKSRSKPSARCNVFRHRHRCPSSGGCIPIAWTQIPDLRT